MKTDERIDYIVSKIMESHERMLQSDPSRICVVVDPPLGNGIEFVIAALPRSVEESYKRSITNESDLQLLWNPAEFPVYGEIAFEFPQEEGDFDKSNPEAPPEDQTTNVEDLVVIACGRANELISPRNCFVYSCDSEMSRLFPLLKRTPGVPIDAFESLPSWLKS